MTQKPRAGYQKGLKAGLPIAIGYLPIALTFGLLSKTYHLSLYDSVGMSLMVFAGASQLMALPMIAMGSSGIELILATFIINIRHLLMSASINEKACPEPKWKKAIYAFGITDETFSVASLSDETISSSYMFGLITMAYGSWVVNTALGFIIGANLPHVLQKSMSIALYAMFIGLVVPSLKKQRKVVFLFIGSALLSSIFSLFLSMGWAIVGATLVSSIGVEAIFYKKGRLKHGS
ncbi:AzlC family ABC transporter permease [Pullulanibacillus sp. KACC 23026]|uniref:AzlC family ABC transporter permease n=1 Tax=Pullulanibacillus sp. KACC 23026 TaxID=3028315 RepID=UPI0023B1AE62|nr:AzlC family ABC transporter permease [Pullulanibacillus sp. KACC 23026]WEG15032.1 AzlC family ABC transporter permease [Pullulanibacillus sp. KACC 23026]